MESKQIEQLLERYWKCETSVEEEDQLRTFFATEQVPAHLKRYKDLFAYQLQEQKIQLGKDFDARVLAQIEEKPVVKARRMSMTARFMPLFKAAAAVAVIISLGHLTQHSFWVDNGTMTAIDTIGKQITAPSVALSEENTAIQEQHILDSLKQAEQKQKQTK